MNFNNPRYVNVIIRVLSISMLASLISAQAPTTITNSDRRPLVGALDQLQNKLGMIVNYEDIPYANTSDLEDVSTPQQRASTPGFHLMVPRKGTVGTAVTAPGDLASLNELLTSYRTAGLPGDFTVEQANGEVYVIATKALAVDGTVQNVVSAMKATITLPYGEQQGSDIETAILNAVGKATGVKIVVGSFPLSTFKKKISFGANNEPARDVLARFLGRVKFFV
jgi:hypothetical protein